MGSGGLSRVEGDGVWEVTDCWVKLEDSYRSITAVIGRLSAYELEVGRGVPLVFFQQV